MPNQNRLLEHLPAELLKSLGPRLHFQKFDARHVLLSPDDDIRNLYFPASGAVSLVVQIAEGEMVESALVGRDGVVGGAAALGEQIAMCTAVVQVGGNGWLLDIDSARRAAQESDEFRRALVRNEQLILLQAQQSAACNVAHTLDQRLARWLLRVRDATGSDSFMLTQEFMAEMLGVQRSTLSIIAHSFKKAGLISFSRGNLRVEDVPGLTKLACACYGEIQRRYEAALKSPVAEHG
jgi:CRP-like cAMP-binding protein